MNDTEEAIFKEKKILLFNYSKCFANLRFLEKQSFHTY